MCVCVCVCVCVCARACACSCNTSPEVVVLDTDLLCGHRAGTWTRRNGGRKEEDGEGCGSRKEGEKGVVPGKKGEGCGSREESQDKGMM